MSSVAEIPSGPELNALVAERVMGWKDVKRHDGRYWAGSKTKRAGGDEP